MPKVTIYTHAYNSEQYLRRCIESVLNQTFADFEYILVDNGSDDLTGEIINEYAKKDKRIKPVRFEENRTGFWPGLIRKMAKGEYLAMLDSDDWLEPEFIETLFAFAEREGLDVAAGGTCFHFLETGAEGYRKSDLELTLDKDEFPGYFGFLYQFFRAVWGKLYKMSVFRAADDSDYHKIVKSAEYGADTVFCLDIFRRSERIGVSDKVLHHYLVRPRSVSYQYRENRFSSDVFLFHKGARLLSGFGAISTKNRLFLYAVYGNAVFDTINVLLKAELALDYKLCEIKKLLREPLTREALEEADDDTAIKNARRSLLKFLIKAGRLNPGKGPIPDLVYADICLLNGHIARYVRKKDLPHHLKNCGFLLSAVNAKQDEMFDLAVASVDRRPISRPIWAALRGVFKKDPILSAIDDRGFATRYPELISDIYAKRYSPALSKIVRLLTGNERIPFQEDLMRLSLGLSDTLGNKDVWIYAKKILTQLYIREQRLAEARSELGELFGVCPGDAEALKLKGWLEAEDG